MKKFLLPMAAALALSACGMQAKDCCCCNFKASHEGGTFASGRDQHNAPFQHNDKIVDGHYYDAPDMCPNPYKDKKAGKMKHK